MTDMTFDSAHHPRDTAGKFRDAEHSTPEVQLGSDRAERLAQAAALEGELNALHRVTRSPDPAAVDDLKTRIAALYARPERQTPPPAATGLQPTNRTVSHYLEHLGAGTEFDLDPPYQRASVWSAEQRRQLILSCIRRIPIGAVLVNNRWATNGYQGSVGYAVVDGKQRIETLRAFVADEFSVPADWFEDAEIADTGEDETVTFSQLTKRGQRAVENWPVPTLEAKEPTIEGEAQLFLLVNGGGTTQTAADMDRARSVARGGGTPV